MTSWKVTLNNDRTVEWEYIGPLGSPGIGQPERGLIRAHYSDPDPYDATDGFGLSPGEAIIDLLRASRDKKYHETAY